MTKIINTLRQEDFHGTFQKLLERYNKCIAAGGDYFEDDLSFMRVLSIKVPMRKSLKIYFSMPTFIIFIYVYIYYIYRRICLCAYVYIYIYIYDCVFMYTYIYISVCVYVCVCECVCVCVSVCL